MKKRIFINMHYLELGGAEMALIGLLNAIDTTRFDVDLFINQHTGALMNYIPNTINLLPEILEYSSIERPIRKIIEQGQLRIALARIRGKLKWKSSLRRRNLKSDGSAQHFIMDEVIKHLPSLKSLGHYDLAISFLDPPHIVQDKVDASVKVEWIHSDFSTIKIDKDVCGPRWRANDYVISISDAISDQFLKTFPEMESKIVKIENILSVESIRSQSESINVSFPCSISLLSVGRFAYAKNYDNIPDICRRIVDSGISEIQWFLIGYGSQEQLIRDKISETGMQNHVIILGKKSNPYPYIKACDIYVQPSRYEGKSITVREAQVLCKPIIITNYPSSRSQIINGVDGIICEMDNASIAQAVIDLIHDVNKRSSLSLYLANHDYGMESEVEKLYRLIS